jgi:hypothetical protein
LSQRSVGRSEVRVRLAPSGYLTNGTGEVTAVSKQAVALGQHARRHPTAARDFHTGNIGGTG